jgi:hypothetical protein
MQCARTRPNRLARPPLAALVLLLFGSVTVGGPVPAQASPLGQEEPPEEDCEGSAAGAPSASAEPAEGDTDPAPSDGPRTQAVVVLRTPEDLEKSVDAQAARHDRAVEAIVQRVERFVGALDRIDKDLETAWQNVLAANGSALSRAELEKAICTAADQGRRAAEDLAGVDTECAELTRELRKGLREDIARAKAEWARVHRLRVDSSRQLATAHAAVLEARRVLEKLAPEEIASLDPETQADLARLQDDYQELLATSDVWEGASREVAYQANRLERSEDDLAQIERLAARVAEAASSSARIFATISGAQTSALEAKLVAEAYARSGELRRKLEDALPIVRRRHERVVRSAGRAREDAAGRIAVGATPAKREVSDPLMWILNFERDGRVARAEEKAVKTGKEAR